MRTNERKEEEGAPLYIRAKQSKPSFERCKVAASVAPYPLPFPSSSSPPTPYKEGHKLPRNLVSPDIKDFPITLAVLRDWSEMTIASATCVCVSVTFFPFLFLVLLRRLPARMASGPPFISDSLTATNETRFYDIRLCFQYFQRSTWIRFDVLLQSFVGNVCKTKIVGLLRTIFRTLD